MLIYGAFILTSAAMKDKTTFDETLNFRPDFSDKFNYPFSDSDFLIAFGMSHMELNPRFGSVSLKHYNVTESMDEKNNTISNKQVESVDLLDCSDEIV